MIINIIIFISTLYSFFVIVIFNIFTSGKYLLVASCIFDISCLLNSGIEVLSPPNPNSCVIILTSGLLGFFVKSTLKTISNLFAASSGQSKNDGLTPKLFIKLGIS